MNPTAIITLIFLLSIECISGCGNYWQSNNDGASSSRRPFDVCYRSYRDSLRGDYSYRYVCNTTIVNENYTANGYTVWKQYYNGVDCQGDPNATLLEETTPYAIYCGGTPCDLVRWRIYDVDPTDSTKGQCRDDNYPESIKELNDYQERVHVIERCDDDGFVSDSYFCSDNYYYINSYNNDKCRNDGIYAAQYYFEGCHHDEDDGEVVYYEMIACGQDSGFTENDQGIVTWGVIFIVLALIAVCCAIAFVVYHCRKSSGSYDITR